MWKKRLTRIVLCIVAVVLIWNHLPYYYSNDKTVDYATNHAEKKSRCMCASYVMIAMWHGGCPIGLLPAYGYNKTLPQMGFKEISNKSYKPQRGDISVVAPPNRAHPKTVEEITGYEINDTYAYRTLLHYWHSFLIEYPKGSSRETIEKLIINKLEEKFERLRNQQHKYV